MKYSNHSIAISIIAKELVRSIPTKFTAYVLPDGVPFEQYKKESEEKREALVESMRILIEDEGKLK